MPQKLTPTACFIQEESSDGKYIYIYIVQSADMHVSAFYASSVQLGTHSHMWPHCIYTRKLALTKRTRYNTTQPTHVRSMTAKCLISKIVSII